MKTPKLNSSLFDAIKQSLQKPEVGGDRKKDYIKFEAGKTALVRLVPYFANPKATIFHYYNHGWKSTSTGLYVGTLCPSTFGEPCPIDNYYLRIWRSGSESEKQAAKDLVRKENWLVNVYVIEDPVNPENNGTVKMLRYGRELNKIIENAISGDDADEFGLKVFDVQNGCTLRIKCEPRTDKGKAMKGNQYITYSSSKFLAPSTLEDVDDEALEKIHETAKDLTATMRVPTTAELQKMLDEHFFNLGNSVTDEEDNNDDDEPTTAPSNKADDEPIIPKKKVSKKVVNETDNDTQAKLRELVADL